MNNFLEGSYMVQNKKVPRKAEFLLWILKEIRYVGVIFTSAQ